MLALVVSYRKHPRSDVPASVDVPDLGRQPDRGAKLGSRARPWVMKAHRRFGDAGGLKASAPLQAGA